MTGLTAATLAATLAGGRCRAEDDAGPDPAGTDEPKSTDEKLDDVDQRLRILERKNELEGEAEAETAKTAGIVSVGKDGFALRSPDGAFVLRLRGYVQTDGRAFSGDSDRPATNTFLLRRARPILEATVGRIFDFRLMADFGSGATTIQDGYLDARFSPKASFRAGKFKPPVGLERLQSATDLAFVERALPTNLVPNRDIGLQIWGGFFDGAIAYQTGVFNGVADGASSDLDGNDTKEFAARLFTQPFKKTASWAQGFGLGIAASQGDNDGTLNSTGLPVFRTAGQQTFFSFLSNGQAAGTVLAGGDHNRLSPQGWFYLGRFGVMAERVRSTQEVVLGASTATIAATAWQATASFFVTDDTAGYKAVAPKRPFDATPHGPGSIELVARAGALTVDEQAFPTFADPTRSARSAREVGAGVNWYLTRNVKFMLDAVQTTFRGGAADGDREDEKVLFSRVQISF